MMKKASQKQRDDEAKAIDCKWLEPCVNSATKTAIKCNKCGHKWMATPNGVQKGKGCIKCYRNSRRASQEQRDQEAAAVNCKWLEPCVSNSKKTKIMCLNCQREWAVRPDDVYKGRGCRKCSMNKRKKSQKEWDADAKKINSRWLEKCDGAESKTLIECLSCGHKRRVTPSSVHSGRSCPKCCVKGFDPSKPSMLYLLKDKHGAIKIGITAQNSRRISNHIANGWKLNDYWHFDLGQDAYNAEQKVIKWWREELNLPPAYKKIDGWTETVSIKDIELDKVKDFISKLI